MSIWQSNDGIFNYNILDNVLSVKSFPALPGHARRTGCSGEAKNDLA